MKKIKLTYLQNNKFNNRYKIICSLPYRKINCYLKKLPYQFRKNFYKNSNTLIIEYDNKKTSKDFNYGHYDFNENKIYYTTIDEEILIHEMLHMASCNQQTKNVGLQTKFNSKLSITEGLNQNFTNKTAKKVYIHNIYSFETLVASMLYNIYGMNKMKYFFLGDYTKFISKFENKYQINKLIRHLELFVIHKEKYLENKHKKDWQKAKNYLKKTVDDITKIAFLELIEKKNYHESYVLSLFKKEITALQIDLHYDYNFLDHITQRLAKLNKDNTYKKKVKQWPR